MLHSSKYSYISCTDEGFIFLLCTITFVVLDVFYAHSLFNERKYFFYLRVVAIIHISVKSRASEPLIHTSCVHNKYVYLGDTCLLPVLLIYQ